MAPPRPGWSRRAQYGLFFSFIAVIVGLVAGIFLLILSLVAPKTFESVRGAALDITGPVSGGLSEVTATAKGLVSGAGNYWDAARQNARLKKERQAMLNRMVEAKAIHQENLQLKAALQLREHSRDGTMFERSETSSTREASRPASMTRPIRPSGERTGMPTRTPSPVPTDSTANRRGLFSDDPTTRPVATAWRLRSRSWSAALS